MPYAPAPYCRGDNKRCPNKATKRGFCEQHYLDYARMIDAKRGNGGQRGWSAEWAAFRKDYLLRHPRCECDVHINQPYGLRPIATDINHLGDASRTTYDKYDESKLQAMAHACHSRYTAQHQPGGWNKRAV